MELDAKISEEFRKLLQENESILDEIGQGKRRDSYPGFKDLLTKVEHRAKSCGLTFELLGRKDLAKKDRGYFVIFRGPELEQAEFVSSYGIVIQAGKERNWDDRAWNRLDAEERRRLQRLSDCGIRIFVLQVWQNLGSTVVLPFTLLLVSKKFCKSGDFTVIREGANFRLQGLSQSGDNYLSHSLADLFSPN